jgi:hypothetical protein
MSQHVGISEEIFEVEPQYPTLEWRQQVPPKL